MKNIKALLMPNCRDKIMKKQKIQYFRKGILIAATVLILAGLCENGFRDIRNKAIRICYECIGIG